VPSDLDKRPEQAKRKEVMTIADKSGMDKTTVLNNLSKRTMKKQLVHWLVRIDLNDSIGLLKTQKGKVLCK